MIAYEVEQLKRFRGVVDVVGVDVGLRERDSLQARKLDNGPPGNPLRMLRGSGETSCPSRTIMKLAPVPSL